MVTRVSPEQQQMKQICTGQPGQGKSWTCARRLVSNEADLFMVVWPEGKPWSLLQAILSDRQIYLRQSRRGGGGGRKPWSVTGGILSGEANHGLS